MKTFVLIFLSLILVFFTGIYAEAWGCAVCYGDPSHPVVQGMNWAILFLLFMIAVVLGGFATFFIKLMKKEKKQVIANGFLVHKRDRV